MAKTKRTFNFTDRGIKALKPPAQGQHDWTDVNDSGFGIRVSYAGSKSWFYKYVHKGRQRRMTFGTYPAITLEKAREKALAAKADLFLSKQDPALQKKADREATTFKELVDLYIEEWAKVNKRTWKEDERMLNKYFAVWHPRKAVDIESEDITERLREIKKDHGPIMANRCLACIRKVYSWALKNSELPSSFTHPALRLDRPGQENPGDRFYNDKEIKALWKAFGDFGISGAVFKMMLITGQRLNEVAGMEWGEIEGKEWTIPGARAKNKLVHLVPLNKIALKELDQKPRLHKRFVFPSPKGKDQPIRNTRKAVDGNNDKKKKHQNIREATGVADFKPKDLRPTFGTNITKLGFSRFIMDRLLNHKEPGIGWVYDMYAYRKEKTEAMNAWGHHLSRLVGKR